MSQKSGRVCLLGATTLQPTTGLFCVGTDDVIKFERAQVSAPMAEG